MPGRGSRWQYCGVPNAMPALRTAPRRPRRRAVLGVVATVLALHALLLERLQGGDAGEPALRVQALQVRQIVRAAAATTPRAAAPRPHTVDARPVAHAAPATAQAAAKRPAGDAPTVAALANTNPEVASAVAADGAADEAAARPDLPPLPRYATRLPPAATLVYALRRGDASGEAELRWQPGDGQYRLTLDGGAAGSARLGSTSTGLLDDGGVAPERHVELRRGRALRAVNFQHEAGRISFSGPSLQLPLQRGSQDRLSWMVQLGAVLAAEPALRAPGSEVRLHVVGTRGDAQVWVFTVQGEAAVDTDAGPVAAALHLRREASRPYDTEVEIWLDPARHHLPVRLRQRLLPAGPETELRLATYEAR